MFAWLLAIASLLTCCFAVTTCVRDLTLTRRIAQLGLRSVVDEGDVLDVTAESAPRVRRAVRNELSLVVQQRLERHALGARLGWRICAAAGGTTLLSLIFHTPRLAAIVSCVAVGAALACASIAHEAGRHRLVARKRCNRELSHFEQTAHLDQFPV